MSIERNIRSEPNARLARRVTRSNYSSDQNSESEPKSDLSIINSSNRFEVIYVDINKVHAFTDQARSHFKEEEIQALSETIKSHGIRNPLTVIGADEGFQVVSGERRLRAAKLAGLRVVPVIIISDDKKAEELALIENIQRVDLHPIELGRAYSKIMSKTNETPQELALRISVPANQVYEYSAYSRIPESVSELIIKYELGRRAFLRHLMKLSTVEMHDYVKTELALREVTSHSLDVAKQSGSEGRKSSSKNYKDETVKLLQIKLKNGVLDIDSKKLLNQNHKNLTSVKVELEKLLQLINSNLEQ